MCFSIRVCPTNCRPGFLISWVIFEKKKKLESFGITLSLSLNHIARQSQPSFQNKHTYFWKWCEKLENCLNISLPYNLFDTELKTACDGSRWLSFLLFCSIMYFFYILMLFYFVWQTDDKGVFSTTLSEEYSLMARTFNLTEEQVWNLTFQSIDYIFGGENLKDDLKELWKTEKEKIISSLH